MHKKLWGNFVYIDCFGFINKNVLEIIFFLIGDLTSLNRSVTCPVIKGFDRTKVKI